MSWEFLLTTFIVVASPGTGALYTLAAGLSEGTRTSLVAAFGCTLGIIPHMIAAVSGVAALFHASDTAFQVLKFAGVAYLLFMAWSLARADSVLAADRATIVSNDRAIVLKAVLINLLNPKLSIFFLAFLPQFVAVDEPSPLVRMSCLGMVFMTMTFVVFAAYGVFASTLREYVLASRTVQIWMQRSFAAAFGLLAFQLAVSNR